LLEQLIVDLEEGVGYLLLHPTSTPCERRFLEVSPDGLFHFILFGQKKNKALNSSETAGETVQNRT
jgi:hypothetical protein